MCEPASTHKGEVSPHRTEDRISTFSAEIHIFLFTIRVPVLNSQQREKRLYIRQLHWCKCILTPPNQLFIPRVMFAGILKLSVGLPEPASHISRNPLCSSMWMLSKFVIGERTGFLFLQRSETQIFWSNSRDTILAWADFQIIFKLLSCWEDRSHFRSFHHRK